MQPASITAPVQIAQYTLTQHWHYPAEPNQGGHLDTYYLAYRKLYALSYYYAARWLYSYLSPRERCDAGPLATANFNLAIDYPNILRHEFDAHGFSEVGVCALLPYRALLIRRWILMGLEVDPDCRRPFPDAETTVWRDAVSKQYIDELAYQAIGRANDACKIVIWAAKVYMRRKQTDGSPGRIPTRSQTRRLASLSIEGAGSGDSQTRQWANRITQLNSKIQVLQALRSIDRQAWSSQPLTGVRGVPLATVMDWLGIRLMDPVTTCLDLEHILQHVTRDYADKYQTVFQECLPFTGN
ncbi:hypothetical protein IWQ60_001962 [Tieghemiomyces parasiticus]|uniref:Uncharacterized protein n=1 Tax=Tieghemiomyces parasiticus TaxID=78921 RepID=A0A9W8AFQ4_9FUNG|nr:hypothetical protein IWQ60_001962 [Tieghemiomyces parasiticus]